MEPTGGGTSLTAFYDEGNQILNLEVLGPEELTFIRYLLKHSINLEVFKINAHKIDPKTCEQLLNFHRASHLCRIIFVLSLGKFLFLALSMA